MYRYRSVLQGKLFGNHVISQFGNIHLPLSPPPVIISCWATLRAKCRVEHSTYKQHNEEGRHKALRLWEGGAGQQRLFHRSSYYQTLPEVFSWLTAYSLGSSRHRNIEQWTVRQWGRWVTISLFYLLWLRLQFHPSTSRPIWKYVLG